MPDDHRDQPAIGAKTSNIGGILSTIAVGLVIVGLLYFGSRMG